MNNLTADNIGALNPFRYRGYYYDVETGLYYLETRYYDPEVGRFLNSDSVEYLDPETLGGLNLYAYCNNNPVMGYDPSGTFWNYVIGGIVGAVIGGLVAGVTSFLENGEVDWLSVGINAAVGAITGVVAASGLGLVAQAGISTVVTGVGNFADQVQSQGIENVNYGDLAVSSLLAGATSLMGSGAGYILGSKWRTQAGKLISLGKDKLLTGMVRNSLGQSHSALMRQGYKCIAQASIPMNIFRGISSTVGSGISSGVSAGYNDLKSMWGW